MSELTKLPNVGKVLEKLLLESGITTIAELKEMGTMEAFMRIKAIDPSACLHMLYGLCGAIEGIPDKLLSQEKKEELKALYKSL